MRSKWDCCSQKKKLCFISYLKLKVSSLKNCKTWLKIKNSKRRLYSKCKPEIKEDIKRGKAISEKKNGKSKKKSIRWFEHWLLLIKHGVYFGLDFRWWEDGNKKHKPQQLFCKWKFNIINWYFLTKWQCNGSFSRPKLSFINWRFNIQRLSCKAEAKNQKF